MLLGLLLFIFFDCCAVVVVNSTHEEITYQDYVIQNSLNADAKRSGTIRLAATGTFHHHNPFLTHGRMSSGALLAYDTLLVASADDISTYYGLIAKTISLSKRSISVTLNDAFFHDGTPLLASDVVQSIQQLIDHGPYKWQLLQQYQLKIYAQDSKTLVFDADKPIPFALLITLGQAPIGKCFDASTCARPIGSGPYALNQSQPSRWVEWGFNNSYWAKNHPVNLGRYHFNTIRYQYYLHPFSAFNSFKLQEYDLRRELYFEQWHDLTQYATLHPSLSLTQIPNRKPVGMQGWIFNMHKAPWQDIRLRRALSLLFPFSALNNNLFRGEYLRLQSYFTNTPWSSTFIQPHSKSERATIEQLLQESGWVMRRNQRIHSESEQVLHVRIVVPDRQLEKIANIYAKSCQDMGIAVTIRRIDSTHYLSSLARYDFDLAYWQFPASLSNVHTLESVFLAPKYRYSYSHLVGLKDDKLAAMIHGVTQSTPSELVDVYQQLDTYLVKQFYTIGLWYPPRERVAYWGNLCRPQTPSQLRTFYHWWHCD